MLLSRVLWAQEVWHWSALQTGLAIAPGPIMVPLFAFLLGGPLIARFGAGTVIAAGCAIFAAGAAWWGLAMGLHPDYVDDMLGGMLLTGIGVGLTMPTFTATGAAALPAHSFATGSGMINMLRQIGLAVGVAVLIAVLGSPRGPVATLHSYELASYIVAGLALAAGLAGLTLLSRRPRAAVGPAGACRGRGRGSAGSGAARGHGRAGGDRRAQRAEQLVHDLTQPRPPVRGRRPSARSRFGTPRSRPRRRGSPRARRRRAPAAPRRAAPASVASLISSRSCSSGLAAMIAWRWRAKERRSLKIGPAGRSAAATSLDRGRTDGRLCDTLDKSRLQLGRAPEQDLALVGEVAEEGPLGQPRPLGDLGDGRFSKPRSPYSSMAACARRPRASGFHRPMS